MKYVFLTTLFALLPIAAFAQTPDEVARAEQHYQTGLSAFQSGDYETAAAEFQSSYDLVPKPELLYNASFALARSGNVDAAREIARDAIVTKLPADIDAKFRARLHGWRTVERAQNPPPAPVVAASMVADEPERELVEAPPAPPARTPRRNSGLRVVSYVTAGLGIVALGTAGVLELQLRAVERDLDNASAAGDLDAYTTSLDRGERLQNAARISLISGGVLVATSVVLWVIARKKQGEAGPQVVWRF